MTEARLPEEVIRDIIILSLPRFRPKTFLKFDRNVNIDSHTQQQSTTAGTVWPVAILSVSKRWLRIGTPLFYKGVVLRKSSHTSAVARLVKVNPAVGRTIRYLRLESGSMTRELVTIAKHAPAIHTLYVEACLREGHSYDGLQRAMCFLRPTTLYINNPLGGGYNYYDPSMTRTTNEMVLRTIVEAWTSVTALHFSDHCIATDSDKWTGALQLPSLEELHIPAPPPYYAPQGWFHWAQHLPHPPFKRLVLYATRHRQLLKAELKDIRKHISYASTVDFVAGSN
ncbi:hypothetical protein PsYK624_079360 [Phanerochaete sordida]|uniref:Uncharacterized protein n=1 Tax=Phanerochaete sordida TaxID=48140 RepID=A0A9P3GDF4_9APHY|nr:hypothetical protein PsYK624_079360 [Phanerochaete sordida]